MVNTKETQPLPITSFDAGRRRAHAVAGLLLLVGFPLFSFNLCYLGRRFGPIPDPTPRARLAYTIIISNIAQATVYPNSRTLEA
jgi:hypothetical protein